MSAWIHDWLERHRHPVSRWLHAVGIPLLIWGLLLGVWQLAMWRWDIWWRPTGVIAVSYLLQWVGHAIEGNDMGEIILIKRLLNRPYVAIAPRYRSESSPSQ